MEKKTTTQKSAGIHSKTKNIKKSKIIWFLGDSGSAAAVRKITPPNTTTSCLLPKAKEQQTRDTQRIHNIPFIDNRYRYHSGPRHIQTDGSCTASSHLRLRTIELNPIQIGTKSKSNKLSRKWANSNCKKCNESWSSTLSSQQKHRAFFISEITFKSLSTMQHFGYIMSSLSTKYKSTSSNIKGNEMNRNRHHLHGQKQGVHPSKPATDFIIHSWFQTMGLTSFRYSTSNHFIDCHSSTISFQAKQLFNQTIAHWLTLHDSIKRKHNKIAIQLVGGTTMTNVMWPFTDNKN